MGKIVQILLFSSRQNGNCANIGNYISNYHSADSVQIHSVHDLQPCGNCNYECLQPGATCPNVTEHQRNVMDAVRTSDLVYYVIPNICGFPCAAFFAFNERGIGYFNMDRAVMGEYMGVKKRFIIVSNTQSDNFKNAVAQQTNEDPDMLYMKTAKYKKRSTAGDILDSEEAVADLKAFLDAYTPVLS